MLQDDINYSQIFFRSNPVLRAFGPERHDITEEWRRLHNDELCDLYSSPNTIRVIKSKTMRWSGHVTRMQERKGAYRVLVEKPEGGKKHLEDLAVD